MNRSEFLHKYREEMQGKPTNIALEQAFWQIGWLCRDELEQVATRMMAESYDAPSLVEIAAGLADTYTISATAEKAFGEIGLEAISREQAGLIVAQQVASRIVTGTLTPDEGVSLLSSMYWPLGCPAYLLPLYVLADYLEEQCYMTPDECRRDIVAEARKLMEMAIV